MCDFEALAALPARFEELRARFDEACRETYTLVAELSGAVEAGRQTLAVTTAACEPDLGDAAVEAASW